jgi:hypothetical protein
VLIATKVRLPMGEGPNDAGLSRHHIMRAVDASLRRLRTDYIDLYQVHEWDGQTPLQETLQALDDLVRSGKVRYIGVSNYAAWHLMKALWTADRHDLTPFVSTQVHCSLQTRDIDNEIVAVRSTKASASWSGVRWSAGCCRASTDAASHRPRAADTCSAEANLPSTTRNASTTSSRSSWPSRRAMESRRRRWRWRTRWPSQPSLRSSSAPGPSNSSPTTSRPPT